jgi:hypothetical protein
VNIEWTGLVLSLTTVATIGIGHVMVRKLNYRFGTKPSPIAAAIGVAVLVSSLFASTTLLSGVLGIVGITTMWDAIELVRQERRVQKGHAPRNPKRMP